MSREFSLADCPTPYSPWIAGATLPEISVTIPLEADEDLTGATVEMILIRSTANPTVPDILEKALVETANVVGSHASFQVDWDASDLIQGNGQQATFTLETAAGDKELIGRFKIDVLENQDPNP